MVLLKDLVQVFPILDADGVEGEQFFERSGPRSPFSAFEVAERGFGYASELDDLGQGKLGAFTQQFEPGPWIIL